MTKECWILKWTLKTNLLWPYFVRRNGTQRLREKEDNETRDRIFDAETGLPKHKAVLLNRIYPSKIAFENSIRGCSTWKIPSVRLLCGSAGPGSTGPVTTSALVPAVRKAARKRDEAERRARRVTADALLFLQRPNAKTTPNFLTIQNPDRVVSDSGEFVTRCFTASRSYYLYFVKIVELKLLDINDSDKKKKLLWYQFKFQVLDLDKFLK